MALCAVKGKTRKNTKYVKVSAFGFHFYATLEEKNLTQTDLFK